MAGTGPRGGNIWGQLLSGALEGVLAKLTQGKGTPVSPPPNPSQANQGSQGTTTPQPQTGMQNPQTAPPMTGAMLGVLNAVLTKMNAQATQVQTQTPPAGQPQGQLGQGPPRSNQPQQQNVPHGDPEQRGLLRRILDSISKTAASPMDFARTKLGGLNRAVDRPEEVIERGRERGGVRGRLEAATGGVIQGLQRHRELQGAGDIAGAAGDVAGMAPVVGKPAESFFKLNEVVLKSIDRLKMWNDRIHQGNIQFAEFSGSMMAVAQESEARRIQLSQQKGQALAESAREQAQARDRLNQTLAPIEIGWKKLEAKINAMVSKVGDIALKIGSFGLLGGPQQPAGQSMHDFMNQVGEEKWPQWYGRPSRFDNGQRIFNRQ